MLHASSLSVAVRLSLRRHGRVVAVAALALCTLAAATPQDAGQATPPPPVAEPVVETADLTVEKLQKRIADLEASGAQEEPAKSELAQLKSALAFLQQAEREVAQTDELKTLAASAPERLKAIEAELAKPLEEQKPSPAPDAKVEEVTPQLEAARAQLEAARKLKDDAERDATARAERRTRVPDEVAETTRRQGEVKQALAGLASSQDPPVVREAKRLSLLAEQTALDAKLARLDQEIRSYDARRDLLRARRQQAERHVLESQRLVDAWSAIVTSLQARAAEQAQRAAERAKRAAAANAHPVVQRVAADNADYAAEIARTSKLNQDLATDKQRVDELLSRWRREYANVQNQVERLGLTDALGLRLRNQRQQLPDLRTYERRLDDRRTEMNRIQLDRIALEDRLLELVDLDKVTAQLLEEAPEPIEEGQRADVLEAVRAELAKQKGYINDLIKAYDSYFDTTLADLQTKEQQLVDLTRQYVEFIDERVLWIQSADALGPQHLEQTWEALTWLTSPGPWAENSRTVWTNLRARPVRSGALGLFVVIILAAQPWMRRRLRNISQQVGRATTDRFSYTVTATILTLLKAAVAPVVLWLVCWQLETAAASSEFTTAVTAALRRLAMLLFAAEFIRQLCRPYGLADAHFRWRPSNLRLVRRHLRWFIPLVFPLAFIIHATGNQSIDAHKDSAGRLAFIAAMLALAVLIQRLFRPDGGILQATLSQHRGGWLDRTRYLWFPLLVVMPLGFAAAAGIGYYYTALQLEQRLVDTAGLVLVILIAHNLLLRWLFVTQRRLAIEQARKKYAAQAKARAEAKAKAGDRGPDRAAAEPPPPTEDLQIDVAAISAQTRSLLRSAVGFAIIISVVVVWADVLPAFGILEDVQIWRDSTAATTSGSDGGGAAAALTGTGEQAGGNGDAASAVEEIVPIEGDGAVTLADLVLALLIVVVTIIVSRNIPGLLEITVLQRLPFTPAGRYAISTVVRYALVIVGVVLAFGAIGIGWSKVQWLAAAITVGLGFGLQEIFANFVSGLILLFEQPIRVGDTVTVGQISGTVTRIRIRATTITDWDRKELIIPNREFVTGQIVNWSLSDNILRVRIPVGIAYGSDTDLAKQTLLKCAKEIPHVLNDPAPQALFLGFGDNSLNFEARVFIGHIDHFMPVRDQMHFAVDRAFRATGIEIAFPQRDIHIRSIKAALPVDDRRLMAATVETADAE